MDSNEPRNSDHESQQVDETETDPTLSGKGFVTFRNPHVFWDMHPRDTQVGFLKGIAPEYFAYTVRTHEQNLDGPDAISAAMAIRIAYSHSMETLFALIGAALQAPNCPAGWMLAYSNSDLRKLVESVQDSSSPSFEYLRAVQEGKREKADVLNSWGLRSPRWDDVTRVLFPWEAENDEHLLLQSQSATLWEAMARDFLDSELELEYNNIKHGMRASLGSGYFAIGTEDSPGVPAPPERMRTMMSSDFGSGLLKKEKLKGLSFEFDHRRVNWDPVVLCRRVELIAASIDNVVQILLIKNGEFQIEQGFQLCVEGALEKALKDPLSVHSMRWSFRTNISANAIPDVTKDEILAAYEKPKPKESDANSTSEK